MYKGGCLCGEIYFEITGEIKNIIYCHCSKCRKAQGSAFATNGNLEEKYFNIIRGEDKLTEYNTGQGQYKYFCKNCGSPIMSKNNSKLGVVRFRLGTIETEIKEKPEAHIFVSSKANWEEINDELPKYNSYN
jgi:hypothetical protein